MFNGFEAIPINCLWAEPDSLMEFIRVMKLESGSEWSFEKKPLDLNSIYISAPPKGGAHLPRFAVWQPSCMSFGSVLIANHEDGLIQTMRHLNKRHAIPYFSAFLSRNHRKQGFCYFEYRGESRSDRVVYVIRDPRWKFFEKGGRLPFENPERYGAKRIADRLTPSILVEYLKSLHWNLESEDFWKSKKDAWLGRRLSFKRGPVDIP